MERLKLWVVLARAYEAVSLHDAKSIAEHGLTRGEFAVLEALLQKGPMLLGEVRKKILVSSGGITYLVDRLVGRGLVERRESPDDRRASFVDLTDAGRALIEGAFPSHAAKMERALSGLTLKETREAIRLLRKVGLHAQELLEPPGGAAATDI